MVNFRTKLGIQGRGALPHYLPWFFKLTASLNRLSNVSVLCCHVANKKCCKQKNCSHQYCTHFDITQGHTEQKRIVKTRRQSFWCFFNVEVKTSGPILLLKVISVVCRLYCIASWVLLHSLVSYKKGLSWCTMREPIWLLCVFVDCSVLCFIAVNSGVC